MQTAPYVKIATEPASQKAVIALLDPNIRIGPASTGIPHIRIVEEDVVIVVEFPNFASLDRFIQKVAAL